MYRIRENRANNTMDGEWLFEQIFSNMVVVFDCQNVDVKIKMVNLSANSLQILFTYIKSVPGFWKLIKAEVIKIEFINVYFFKCVIYKSDKTWFL